MRVLRNTKIANLAYSLLGHEDVLSFDVAVYNFSVVDMLNSETDLREPIQNLLLRQVATLL